MKTAIKIPIISLIFFTIVSVTIYPQVTVEDYSRADSVMKLNDFVFLVLPGEKHTAGGKYGERKRRDFFVKHLLQVEPPDWNKTIENEPAN